jgi:hypothetical protein
MRLATLPAVALLAQIAPSALAQQPPIAPLSAVGPPAAQPAPAAPSAAPAAPTEADRMAAMEAQMRALMEMMQRMQQGQQAAAPAPAAAPAAASSAAPTQAAAAATPRVQVRPGMIANVLEVRGERVTDSLLGDFVVSSFPLRMNAHAREVQTRAPVAYRMEGFLVAREAGRYTFAIELRHPGYRVGNGSFHPPAVHCFASLGSGETNVASVAIAERNSGDSAAVADEATGVLEVSAPGAVPVALTVACRDFTAAQQSNLSAQQRTVVVARDQQAEVVLRVRAPGDRSLRPIRPDEVVHRVGQ